MLSSPRLASSTSRRSPSITVSRSPSKAWRRRTSTRSDWPISVANSMSFDRCALLRERRESDEAETEGAMPPAAAEGDDGSR